jgi:prepilin-type N-terminal cleavage/methylation domain-containing protein
MKSRLHSRIQAGFTLIELLVVQAILAILIPGYALITNRAAFHLGLHPRFKAVASDILQFNQSLDANVKAFVSQLADDAANAGDLDPSQVQLDSLKVFCDADTKLAGLQSQVNALLAEGSSPGASSTSPSDDDGPGDDGSPKQLGALRDVKNALDAELPAVQKLGNLLRTKGGDVCPPVLQ